MTWYLGIAAAAGYLLGSLPFGYLVARAHGVDIFKVGSGNPGATNVKRVLGAKAGGMVLGLDALKGALAAGWSLLSYTSLSVTVDLENGGDAAVVAGQDWRLVGLAGIIGAVLGHSFSLFTKFRGGKGVATAAGGLFVLIPAACAIAGLTWLVVFYASRYVSLASILAAVAVIAAGWLLDYHLAISVVVSVIALFVILRHRENITRLLAGTESKFVKKPPAES
jgi:glycerol-3-phosphate acyltransferase PlsY